MAQASRQALVQAGTFEKPIATEIVEFTKFYPAEDYHQDYFKKEALRYKLYRQHSGRDQFLTGIWGNESAAPAANKANGSRYSRLAEAVLKEKLTPLQYKVTNPFVTSLPAARSGGILPWEPYESNYYIKEAHK